MVRAGGGDIVRPVDCGCDIVLRGNFASVYIARQSVVSWGSLTYAGLFMGLYCVAHLVARRTVPHADPYLLPMAALLTALGLTEIYRLNPDDAFRQALWVVIGVGLFSFALITLRRDYRPIRSVKIGKYHRLVFQRLPGR